MAVAAAATAALFLLVLLIPGPAAAVSPSDAVRSVAAATLLGDSMSFQRGRGGDSMGKPPKKLRPDGLHQRHEFLAGDSMGRSGSGRGGSRPPRRGS